MPRASRRPVIGKRSLLVVVAAVVVSSACGQSQPGLPSIHFVSNASCSTRGQQPYFAPSPANVNGMPPVGQAIDEMPHSHVSPPTQITYNHDPPTSGCHYNLGYGSAPIQAGAYDQVIRPEYWVHNLEHGYIVVFYNCPSGCDVQFQQLRTWYRSLPPDPTRAVPYAKVLILPWPTLHTPFAAASWDWYYPMPEFNIDEVQRFYASHVGQGAEPSAP
jgi:hypothetical protein